MTDQEHSINLVEIVFDDNNPERNPGPPIENLVLLHVNSSH